MSKDDKKLAVAKNRDPQQKILQELDSFSSLKANTRVPQKFKKLVRRSKKTSFIYPNKKSFRVVDKNLFHFNFIKKFKILYSTSANENKKQFDFHFAYKKADVVVYTKDRFKEYQGSTIYKLTKSLKKKIR